MSRAIILARFCRGARRRARYRVPGALRRAPTWSKGVNMDFIHSNVAKASVFLTDLGNFQALNAIYAEYFGDHKPARTTVQVAGLPKGAALEIDLIAVM